MRLVKFTPNKVGKHSLIPMIVLSGTKLKNIPLLEKQKWSGQFLKAQKRKPMQLPKALYCEYKEVRLLIMLFKKSSATCPPVISRKSHQSRKGQAVIGIIGTTCAPARRTGRYLKRRWRAGTKKTKLIWCGPKTLPINGLAAIGRTHFSPIRLVVIT